MSVNKLVVRSSSGQSLIEYIGVIAVVAVLVGGVLFIAPGLAGAVSHGLSCAVKGVLHGGRCEKSHGSGKPPSRVTPPQADITGSGSPPKLTHWTKCPPGSRQSLPPYAPGTCVNGSGGYVEPVPQAVCPDGTRPNAHGACVDPYGRPAPPMDQPCSTKVNAQSRLAPGEACLLPDGRELAGPLRPGVKQLVCPAGSHPAVGAYQPDQRPCVTGSGQLRKSACPPGTGPSPDGQSCLTAGDQSVSPTWLPPAVHPEGEAAPCEAGTDYHIFDGEAYCLDAGFDPEPSQAELDPQKAVGFAIHPPPGYSLGQLLAGQNPRQPTGPARVSGSGESEGSVGAADPKDPKGPLQYFPDGNAEEEWYDHYMEVYEQGRHGLHDTLEGREQMEKAEREGMRQAAGRFDGADGSDEGDDGDEDPEGEADG